MLERWGGQVSFDGAKKVNARILCPSGSGIFSRMSRTFQYMMKEVRLSQLGKIENFYFETKESDINHYDFVFEQKIDPDLPTILIDTTQRRGVDGRTNYTNWIEGHDQILKDKMS